MDCILHWVVYLKLLSYPRYIHEIFLILSVFINRGHSLHLIKTESESIYKGDMYLVMFGGRDNDQKTQHIPKTYDVKEVCL